ncbi:ATP phosphoribosyltransferase [Paenibacillus sp. CCS19]|nr:ATP phosphoribosyltransferase [Paenibacillus cellulosilyticus]
MQTELHIALPKGNQSVSHLFRQAGYPLPCDLEESRNYIISLPNMDMSFILAKAIDIPTYVAYGVADAGIVGKEVLLENPRNVYELLDLTITKSTLAVLGNPGAAQVNPRVATPYPRIASQYYRNKGQQAKIIPLNGSLELALAADLADCIVDIPNWYVGVDSNELVVLDTIQRVSCRLIANRASYTLYNEQILTLCERLSVVSQSRLPQ